MTFQVNDLDCMPWKTTNAIQGEVDVCIEVSVFSPCLSEEDKVPF